MSGPTVKPSAGAPSNLLQSPMTRWSWIETQQQMDLLEDMVTRLGVFTMVKLQSACEAKLGRRPSQVRIKRLLGIIHARWAAEDAANRPSIKAQAVRRVYDHIRRARGHEGRPAQGTPGQPGYVPPIAPVKPAWSSIARFEELLADFQGTREAIRVQLDVNVPEALMNVIASMSPEQVKAAIEEERERDRLVEMGRRALAAGAGVVVTQSAGLAHTNGNGRGHA